MYNSSVMPKTYTMAKAYGKALRAKQPVIVFRKLKTNSLKAHGVPDILEFTINKDYELVPLHYPYTTWQGLLHDYQVKFGKDYLWRVENTTKSNIERLMRVDVVAHNKEYKEKRSF